MKVIYVAGKYSADSWSGIDDNIRAAKLAALKLWRKGWAVICPHTNSGHFDDYEVDGVLSYDTWIDADLEFVNRSDAIFMVKGWPDSKGARQEKEKAEEWGVKVFLETDGYPSPEDIE